MNKRIFSVIAAVVALTMTCSCSKEFGKNDDAPETLVKEQTICATISDVMAKVSFDPTYESGKPTSMTLAWEEGDALRVYDHANRSNYDDFSLKATSIGEKTGVFTGTLVNAASASSFDVEVIGGAGFDYAKQTQPSDGVTTNLKYLASVKDITNLAAVEFNGFSSVMALTAKMPKDVAANIKSVDITASEDIFNGGKTLSITFTNKGDADNDDILHFFATLPQGNQTIAAGTTLLMHFNAPDATHKVYTRFITLGAQTFSANKLNTINVNATKSDVHAGDLSCDGSNAAKSYLIGDKYQMQYMKNFMVAGATKYFKMVDDVDLNNELWEPLNYVNPWDKAIFFDGGNHTIDHLSVDGSKHGLASFTGVLEGTVQDVKFTNATIVAESQNGGVVGGYIGLAGKKTGSCINVMIDKATMTASGNISGILGARGDNMGTIQGCKVTNSSITSLNARVGGLIGSVVTGDISECSVENTSVTSSNYYAGGLVGAFNGNGTISKCHASGTGVVKSTATNYSRTGGLVGQLYLGKIVDSYATCNVEVAGYYGGGFVGEIQNGTISKCYSTGTVTSTNHYSGGLIGVATADSGKTWEALIEKSYFNGTISLPTGGSGKAQAGGLISAMDGSTKVTIKNCYTSGNWAGRRWFGGFVGYMAATATSLNITNCFTNASITGSPSGALIGNNNNSAITASGNIAWWASGNIVAAGTSLSSGCYIGKDVTISAKAKEFGWDEAIWDLSGSVPTLK